jgi:hypothetical protein
MLTRAGDELRNEARFRTLLRWPCRIHRSTGSRKREK